MFPPPSILAATVRLAPVLALAGLLLVTTEAAAQAPSLRGSVPDVLTVSQDEDLTSDAGDPLLDDMPRPGAGERMTVVDGDLTLPEERTAIAREGIVEVGEPPAPEDGGDATLVDSRTQEEADLFTTALDSPPAGFDPLLFQIEDIDPLRTDRRPRRLFEQEPYDPIGIRVGSFVYFPEVTVAGETTSNVLRQSPARDDTSVELLTRARLVSNWNVHALEFNASGLTSFHNDFPSENDAAWNVEARGRLDVSRNTNVQGLIAHDVRQEGRSAIDAAQFGDRAVVAADTADLTLNHRFNRLSVQLRGGYDDIDYGPSGTGNSNADRDTRVATEAIRTTWQFKPSFSIFGEIETNQRRYNVAAVADGFSRDSDGQRFRAGVDFGSTARIIRGEFSLGHGSQDPSDPGLSDVDGVLIDANVAWRISEPTTLRFLARTDLYDTNTAGSAGVVSRALGVEARHVLRRHLVATAGLTYTDQDYDDVPIRESEVRSSLLLEYYVNREWTVFSQWEHINYDSNLPDNSWVANDLRVGARWWQ